MSEKFHTFGTLKCPKCHEKLRVRGSVIMDARQIMELRCTECDRLILECPVDEFALGLMKEQLLGRPEVVVTADMQPSKPYSMKEDE